MDRFALFVDAGYLLAAGQWACTGRYRPRGQYEADLPALAGALKRLAAQQQPTKELLRVYWYDAAPARLPTSEQIGLSYEDDVVVRVGALTTRGVQKGVDALIILDMYDHALSHSITDAYLVAGDGDLVEGVTRSQVHGVRTTVWSFRTEKSTVAPDLIRAADRHSYLDPELVRGAFRAVETAPVIDLNEAAVNGHTSAATAQPGPTTMAGPSPERRDDELTTFPATVSTIEGAQEAAAIYAGRLRLTATAAQIEDLLRDRPMLPRETDIQLIRATLHHLGVDWGTRLSTETVYAMREAFFAALDSFDGAVR